MSTRTLLKTAGFPLGSRALRPLEVRVETSPSREFYKSFVRAIGVAGRRFSIRREVARADRGGGVVVVVSG